MASITPTPQQRIIVEAADAAANARLHAMVAAAHGEVTAELPIIDGFAATMPASEVAGLRAAAVAAGGADVLPDRQIALSEPTVAELPRARWDLHVATKAVNLPDVWAQGFKGKGIGVAVLDTGMAPHRDYQDRIVAFKDIVNGRTDPYDDRGHGTHVAGILAGNGAASGGKYCGAAPEASLIGVKVMNAAGQGQISDIIQGVQWAVENKERYNIRVINMSLGAAPEVPLKKDPLVAAVDKATQAGILVVAAAGNRGPYPNTIDTPASAPSVLAVGATIDYRTPDLSDDKVAWYSGSGPTSFDRLTKPDVVAPGTYIICPDANGGYASDTGTSMATPLVAGIAALMIQARPQVQPSELKQLFRDTAHKIRNYEENVQGKGYVQPAASLRVLQHQPSGGGAAEEKARG